MGRNRKRGEVGPLPRQHRGPQLDFSLVGILARISSILAAEEIGIFAVSTFDTDYILVKAENLDRALSALARAGYETGAGEEKPSRMYIHR